jgi:hypothetical protein
MRMDIENMLGVTRNIRTLGNTTTNTIQPAPSRTTGEVRNLVRNNEPFKHKANHNHTKPESNNITDSNRTNPIDSGNNITENTQSNRKHKHRDKSSHGHSSRSHGRSSRDHGHSSRSHGHSNRNHGHSSRSHGHSDGYTRRRRNYDSAE